jgi:hypothetical protein
VCTHVYVDVMRMHVIVCLILNHIQSSPSMYARVCRRNAYACYNVSFDADKPPVIQPEDRPIDVREHSSMELVCLYHKAGGTIQFLKNGRPIDLYGFRSNSLSVVGRDGIELTQLTISKRRVAIGDAGTYTCKSDTRDAAVDVRVFEGIVILVFVVYMYTRTSTSSFVHAYTDMHTDTHNHATICHHTYLFRQHHICNL